MWWRNYLIAFIITSIIALVALASCGRPEPVVREKVSTEQVVEEPGEVSGSPLKDR